MWNEVVNLFTGMGWVAGVLLSLGIILSVAEIFTPGLGVCGIAGTVCVIGGIIARMLNNGSVTQLFIMLFGFIILVLLVFLMVTYSAKKGVLSKTPFVETSVAVSREYATTSKEILKLVDKTGKVIADLKPTGKVEIEGKDYEAQSLNQFIVSGEKIKVVKIDGEKIVVDKIEE